MKSPPSSWATSAMTGPAANAAISSMRSRACSSSSWTTTTESSGSSRATASVTSARSIAVAVTWWPRRCRLVEVRSNASRSSSAARMRRPSAGSVTRPILRRPGPKHPPEGPTFRRPIPPVSCAFAMQHDISRAQEERLLFTRLAATRDPALRDQLVERYLPLARQLARRYQRPDEPMDDLVQVAALGLVKAIDRFDATRAVAFSSYAVPTILGEIKRHFRDRTWSVRVPRDLQELALKVERTVGDMTRELHRSPSVTELSERVGANEEQVLEALEAAGAYHATSLETPRGSEAEPGETLADTIGGDEDGYDRAEARATIAQLMRAITPREREVLRLRFEEDLTQAEIGEIIGVSQMQVSRLIRQAVSRLRLAAHTDPDVTSRQR
ncbi:SigB/SigF/SigG family RNA polymerase sigma factor [Baekduia soli]|uniref:SigB/SigF/SigG family RNA polymerase sigma factor n=2 Tax=Baekduia soli TaxID=496014 RepID=A0A5B8UBK8_9ACTN|nr:SigB/SigF/SigG family RNA polymerase sigma factor [Baekduia soli]